MSKVDLRLQCGMPCSKLEVSTVQHGTLSGAGYLHQSPLNFPQPPSLHAVSSLMKLNWGFNNPSAFGTSLNQSWKCAFVRSVMTKKSRCCSSKESQRSSTKKSRYTTRSINL